MPVNMSRVEPNSLTQVEPNLLYRVNSVSGSCKLVNQVQPGSMPHVQGVIVFPVHV